MLRLTDPLRALSDCMIGAASMLSIHQVQLRDNALVPVTEFFEDIEGIAAFLEPAGVLFESLYRKPTGLHWPILMSDTDEGVDLTMLDAPESAPFTLVLRLMLWLFGVRGHDCADGVMKL